MVFDLREQNFGEVALAHVMLSRPRMLQYPVIAIREERVSIALQYRLQEVQSSKSIVQEHLSAHPEAVVFRRQSVQSTQIRTVDPAILEQTHSNRLLGTAPVSMAVRCRP
jgi:hypothetical protein